MTKHKLQVSIVLAVASHTWLLAGCASQKLYLKSSESFSAGTKDAAKIAADEAKLAVKSRRVLGVLYYLRNPATNVEFNLDKDKPENSFVRFVCTGKGQYEEELAALSDLVGYADVLERLAQTPKDDVGVLDRASTIWTLLHPKPAPGSPPGPPPSKDEQYSRCAQEVQQMVRADGQMLVPRPDEFGIAALAAVPAIYEAAKKALEVAGRVLEGYARAKAVKTYVEGNATQVNALLTQLQTDPWLPNAQIARKQVAVAGPYLRFQAMLRMPTASDGDRAKVFAEGESIAAELVAYDELRISDAGANALKAAQLAQADLQRLAAGSLTPEEAWSVFQGYAKDMKDLAEAAKEANKAINEALAGKE